MTTAGFRLGVFAHTLGHIVLKVQMKHETNTEINKCVCVCACMCVCVCVCVHVRVCDLG